MRRFIRAAALLLPVLLLQACAAVPGAVVQVEETDSTRVIELKTGQVLDIRLGTFPGRGLTLSLGSIVTPILVLEGRPTYNDDMVRDNVRGTGSFESWRFRAVQPGEVTVRMDYRLQWEMTGAPTRSVNYDVFVTQ